MLSSPAKNPNSQRPLTQVDFFINSMLLKKLWNKETKKPVKEGNHSKEKTPRHRKESLFLRKQAVPIHVHFYHCRWSQAQFHENRPDHSCFSAPSKTRNQRTLPFGPYPVSYTHLTLPTNREV